MRSHRLFKQKSAIVKMSKMKPAMQEIIRVILLVSLSLSSSFMVHC